jgi:diguanylate cyclase (GGDEF)-like protein
VHRPGDFVARYGGEELVMILPNADAAGALRVGEQVRAAIEALRMLHLANPEGRGGTASIGVATALCRVGVTMKIPEALLAAADTALYKAKHNGRNRVASILNRSRRNGRLDQRGPTNPGRFWFDSAHQIPGLTT